MNQTYPFKAEPLPYTYDSLEPFIDTETLHFHHDKHYQTYVDNLNKILEPYNQYHNLKLKELLLYINNFPQQLQTPIINNAGGVYNHQLYFNLMQKPSDSSLNYSIINTISEQFGDFKEFKDQFTSAALSQFGSGYAWLVCYQNGKLSIENTPNQNTPNLYMVNPILLIDVWEHAYYLKYQNRRADYINNWFNVINWEYVDYLYKESLLN